MNHVPHPHNLWRVRALGPDGSARWVAVVQSDYCPDGTEVELPEAEAVAAIEDRAAAFAYLDCAGDVVRLEVTAKAAPQAPPLWFAELEEPGADPPATALIAFTGHGIEPGTLLDRLALRELGLTTADQVGMFRWHPATGFADQLYVAPSWRRRTIATALLAASGTLTFARGWPRMWGDGQRTAEGEKMRNSSQWSHQTAQLTHLMLPITPLDERPDGPLT